MLLQFLQASYSRAGVFYRVHVMSCLLSYSGIKVFMGFFVLVS